MTIRMHDLRRNASRLLLLPLAAVLLVGCGKEIPKLHTVAGKIDLVGGNASLLTGSAVEVALASNQDLRGFGRILPDSSFQIESLQKGDVYKGIPEGTYLVRIIPNEEDPETQANAAKALASKYLRFESSGLRIEAPDENGTTLLTLQSR